MFDKEKILAEAKSLQTDILAAGEKSESLKEQLSTKYSYLSNEYPKLFEIVYLGHPHYDIIDTLKHMLGYAEKVNDSPETMETVEKTEAGVFLANIFDPEKGVIARNKQI